MNERSANEIDSPLVANETSTSGQKLSSPLPLPPAFTDQHQSTCFTNKFVRIKAQRLHTSLDWLQALIWRDYLAHSLSNGLLQLIVRKNWKFHLSPAPPPDLRTTDLDICACSVRSLPCIICIFVFLPDRSNIDPSEPASTSTNDKVHGDNEPSAVFEPLLP